MTLPRSVAGVVSRHVLFEIESIDRMYLNLYVPQLQRVEGVMGFIHGHLGQPIASTSAIAPMSRGFVARLAAFAGAQGIPWVDFARRQRKDDVMHEYLAAFEAAGRREGVLFIGRAQEKNTVFGTEKRRAADGRSYPWIVRTTSVVNQFYVHCVDEDFGAFFIKFSSYFPYGGKLLINGHHYAQAQAAKAGIGFTALDNGFAACDDVAGLQAICDSLTEDKIEALARKWLSVLPSPYSAADQAAGYRYDLSILQAEFSLTQVLDKPVSARMRWAMRMATPSKVRPPWASRSSWPLRVSLTDSISWRMVLSSGSPWRDPYANQPGQYPPKTLKLRGFSPWIRRIGPSTMSTLFTAESGTRTSRCTAMMRSPTDSLRTIWVPSRAMSAMVGPCSRAKSSPTAPQAIVLKTELCHLPAPQGCGVRPSRRARTTSDRQATVCGSSQARQGSWAASSAWSSWRRCAQRRLD